MEKGFFFSYNFSQFFWLSIAFTVCSTAISMYISSLPFKANFREKMRKHER